MKKQIIGTMALLITLSLTGCTSTSANSDESAKSDNIVKSDDIACNTILNEATHFAYAHKEEIDNMNSPFDLLKVIKPFTASMDKAAAQAKTEDLSNALTKISEELKKDRPNIIKLSSMQGDLKTIDSICKDHGVDIMAKINSL